MQYTENQTRVIMTLERESSTCLQNDYPWLDFRSQLTSPIQWLGGSQVDSSSLLWRGSHVHFTSPWLPPWLWFAFQCNTLFIHTTSPFLSSTSCFLPLLTCFMYCYMIGCWSTLNKWVIWDFYIWVFCIDQLLWQHALCHWFPEINDTSICTGQTWSNNKSNQGVSQDWHRVSRMKNACKTWIIGVKTTLLVFFLLINPLNVFSN